MITETLVARRLLADVDHPPVPDLDADRLVGLLRDAGLTGRGGAGFPVWRKLSAVLASGRPVTIVGNGAEGEPASGKDRLLLTGRPHLVADGLRILARATHARGVRLYLPRETPWDIPGIERLDAPDRFVASEETAVVAALAGRPAVPADKRVRITDRGFLVQNVETLAHIALIARYGPSWFRSAGTREEPGTFLASVSGAVRTPGVVEAEYGTRLGVLLDGVGAPVAALRAVLVGGYHGGWAPADPQLPISRAGLAPHGASPGAGVVIALPHHACGLAETARIASYLASEVAGRCGPCVNGMPRMADTLHALVRGRADAAEVERLAAVVSGRGACRHPDGTARMVRTALKTFATDVAAHLSGRCEARHG